MLIKVRERGIWLLLRLYAGFVCIYSCSYAFDL